MDSNSTPSSPSSPDDDAAKRDPNRTARHDASPSATHRPGSNFEANTLWLVGSTLATAGIGCVAGLLQVQHIAPVALLPVAVGVGLAMAADGLGQALGLRIGRGWIVAAIVWALLAIVAEVYIGHWSYLRDLKNFEQNNPRAALFADKQDSNRPASLLRYFQSRFDQSPILLSADAVLTVVAAAGWMEYRRRRAAVARAE